MSGPKDNGCGGYVWQVAYALDKPAAADGWMIQEITVVYDIKDGKGDVVNNETVHYWEAWEVKKGATKPIEQGINDNLDAYNDGYTEPSRAGTKGSSVVTGTLKFYQGTLPPDFIANNPNTQAGILRATTTKPDFWDGTGTKHDMTANWDCTKSPGTSNVTGKAGDAAVTGTK